MINIHIVFGKIKIHVIYDTYIYAHLTTIGICVRFHNQHILTLALS